MSELETRKKFKRALKYRKLSQGIILGGAFIMIGARFMYSIWMVVIGVLSLISGIVLNLIYWKCPYCHKYLPMREPMGGVDYCPKCGKQLPY